jgi:hypothetical protein
MAQSQLPLEALPAWARLYDVEYHNVDFRPVDGKGVGLVATDNISSSHGQQFLMRIPHDLVLSQDAVDAYTKIDQNFKQLLEVAGHQAR